MTAADRTGTWFVAVVAPIVLFGLPALSNTPGDRASAVVATPGPVHALIEMVLLAAAVVVARIVWPSGAAIVVTLVGVALIATGLPRYRWLAAGAPPQMEPSTETV